MLGREKSQKVKRAARKEFIYKLHLLKLIAKPTWYYFYIFIILFSFPLALELTRSYNIGLNAGISSEGVNYLLLIRHGFSPTMFALAYFLLTLPVLFPMLLNDSGLRNRAISKSRLIINLLRYQIKGNDLLLNIITLLILPLVMTLILNKPQHISELIQARQTYIASLTEFAALRILIFIIQILLNLFRGGDNITAVSSSFLGILSAITISIIAYGYYSFGITEIHPAFHQIIKEGYRQERIIIFAIYSIFIYFHTFIATRFSVGKIDLIRKEKSNLLLTILITFMVGFAIVAIIVLYNELGYVNTQLFIDRVITIHGPHASLPLYRELLNKHIIYRSGFLMLICVVGTSIAFSVIKIWAYYTLCNSKVKLATVSKQ